jgi:cell division protein FtsW
MDYVQPKNLAQGRVASKKRIMERGGIDLTFLILVLLLLAIGLIMLFSASYAYAYYHENGNSFYYISRQLVFAIVGVPIMLIIAGSTITSSTGLRCWLMPVL